MRPGQEGERSSRQGPRAERLALGLVLFLVLVGPASLAISGGGGPAHRAAGPTSVATAEGRTSPSSTYWANFTISPSSGSAPLNVDFTAEVSGGVLPYQYNWDFGDGTTGVGNPVNHTYQDPGTYEAVLEVTDGVGQTIGYEQTFTVSAAPSTPPYLSYILGGAVVAAVLGVGVGVYFARRTGGSPEDDSGPDVPELPSTNYVPPGAFASPPYQVIPRWVTQPLPPSPREGPLPYQEPHPGYRSGAPVSHPSSTPAAPAAPYPPRPQPYVPPAPARPPSPPMPPPGLPAQPAPAPHPSPTLAPPVAAKPSPPPIPPQVRYLFELPPEETTAPLASLAALNAVSWDSVAQETGHAPATLLSRALRRIEPYSVSVHRRCQDPARIRLLLRDRLQEWRAAPSAGASAPPAPTRYANLLATSSGSDTPPLSVRMGEAESSMLWQALVRMAPTLVFILIAFVGVEAATFFALYFTFAGATPTPAESLLVPVAVLGPPAILLFAYPIVEWGHLLWRRSRRHDADERLFTLPQIRMVSYLLVLGLAETSRVLADLASTTLFGTPSSILQGGGVSVIGVLGFLAVISATLFFGWTAISNWNVGGSRRATLCSALLYVMVLAVWVGAEGRLFLYFARTPSWSTVASAQGLLLDVPVSLLVACAFVVTVFMAFTEPQWQREHRSESRTRLSVAQAVLDDLDAHPNSSGTVAMERLSDLSRGSAATKVAQSLRDLFVYDPDSDRYVALHAVDGGVESYLFLRARPGPSGAFYLLEPTTVAAAPGAAPGSPGALPSDGTPDTWWERNDLTDAAAWTALLRARKTNATRLPRPPTDARDGPVYKSLIQLLIDPTSDELRDLFRRAGWTKPSGPMLLVRLIQSGKSGEALCPDIETDGEYLEVELNRCTGHLDSSAPYLGPWDLGPWVVTREVQTGAAGGISYRATPKPGATPAS
jgi:PKD repeat protein